MTPGEDQMQTETGYASDGTLVIDFKCPNCGSIRVVYEEQVWEYRNVEGIDDAGQVHVVDTSERYEYDEGENARWCCRECYHTWPFEANQQIVFGGL